MRRAIDGIASIWLCPKRQCLIILTGVALFATGGCDPKPRDISSSKPAPSDLATPVVMEAGAVTAPAAPSSKSVTAVPPKLPAGPSPEQIAKWNIVEESPLQLLACPDTDLAHYLLKLAILPDGKQFVLAGGKLTIWSFPDLAPMTDFLANYKSEDVERPIQAVSISPNGEWLAAGDQKGRVRIWTIADQRETVSIRAHDGRVTAMAFSPDSQMLATSSYSGEVKIWQSANGTLIKTLKASQREVVDLQFLSDVLLAAAGNEVSIWNLATGKGETVLTSGSVSSPAIGLSHDRQLLAFVDSDSKTHLWDVQKKSSDELPVLNTPAQMIAFSHDGKRIATHSAHSGIRIWDAATGSLTQVIDADGGRTVSLQWHPQGDALVIASEFGAVRIWGTPEAAKSLGLDSISLPPVSPATVDRQQSLTSAQLQRIIDIRSFPQLPDAVPQFGDFGMAAYSTSASQKEAESFYRYLLGKAGWTESTTPDPSQPGLNFRKEGCGLNVTFSQVAASPANGDTTLQISLHFAGNVDVRRLPQFEPVKSKSAFSSISFVIYRTKSSLTDVEVALLKQFHDAGWTAWSRLAATGIEDANSRHLSFLQNGSVLTVSIGRPADMSDVLAVQISVNVSNKSLPIPADAGWVEFDSSTDLQLVANTRMDLNETTTFYDREMVAQGWIVRETGRSLKEDKAWLPYIQGQCDVLIRLIVRPEGGTRVIVGDAERSSWQLQKPEKTDEKTRKNGIEAADFPLPAQAAGIKFEIDSKQILFDHADTTPPKLADQIAEKLEGLGWNREDSGITSDDYVLARFSKSKAEIQLRVRTNAKMTSAMIGGTGLAWSKSLPTSPERVSYEIWMRRARKDATLDLLDAFAEEMRK